MTNQMNDMIKLMLERRSIRKYEEKQIPEELLEPILEAGLYAPSAGGRQTSFMVVCQDNTINQTLGKVKSAAFKGRYSTPDRYISKEQPSIADDPNIHDAFYGAPTVVTIFSPKDFLFGGQDTACMAENMLLAAHSLGIASCFIGSAWEAFDCERGKELLKKWEIPGNYHADVQVLLGYSKDAIMPTTKLRKENRIRRA
jgi:nitroreductase